MTKKMMTKFVFGTLALLLTGCAATNGNPPQLAEELGYSAVAVSGWNFDERWWEQYGSAELNHLVEQALAANPDYLQAALKVRRELYNLNLANRDLWPTLSGNLAASGQRRIDTHDNYSSNFSGELGLKYELDLYGKIRDAASAQEFEYRATVMDKEAARLTLINSVTDLYFNLEYLHNSLQLTEDNIKAFTEIEKITQNKFAGGKADGLQVAEARQSLTAEKNRLLELQTAYREMEQSLRNILNLPPEQNLELSYGDILQQEVLPVDTEVPLAVLAKRPDLAAEQYRLEKSFKTWQGARKNWYPNISLKGALGSASDKARTTFDLPYVLGSVSVDLPFLDWNRVKNDIKVNKIDYQIALSDFRQTLNQAVNELAYYYYAYTRSGEMYNNLVDNYKNAVEISAYYKNRYDNGRAEFKDYLEAVNTENSTRKNLVQQKYQIIKYENYIYKAIAGRYTRA